eukprot:TRINITY_DN869_c3_g1_i1.p1 TRINITY_DN869_c3_g1~~TRINITY_DN869_c3_g1_i1.p1  ORF type:complete len:520 (-),score=120.59 TRINITY_DN869_c3_g1_i1:521-2080(-)
MKKKDKKDVKSKGSKKDKNDKKSNIDTNKKKVWINKKILENKWVWRRRSLVNLKSEEDDEIPEEMDYDLRSSLELNEMPINFNFKKPMMEKQKSETKLFELLPLIDNNIHIMPNGSKNTLKVGTPDSLLTQLQNHARSEFKYINKITEKIPTSQTERERIYPTATHPSNANKNRYPNVLANEKTMVTLKDSHLDLSSIEKKEMELSHNFPGLFPTSPRGTNTTDPIGVKKLKKKSGFYKKNASLHEPLDFLASSNRDSTERSIRKSSHNFNSLNKNLVPPLLKEKIKPENVPQKTNDEYINANFIQVSKCDEKYISCQAPLPSTMLDFWRMVWQQNTSVIVCLTDFYEGGKLKAHRYWPDEDEEEINWKYYSVSLKKKIEMNGYEISILTLKKMKQERQIYHFFYTEWPDFGVPDTTTTLLDLIQTSNLYRVRGAISKINGPAIVHCSAGLGRTGTFVALAFSLNYLLRGKYPIVHKIISSMRDQRHGMVQTEEQYFFVFEALNDYVNNRLGRFLLKDI